MSELPTPETDASEMPIDRIDTVASRPCRVVISEFARKLERERDESREQLAAERALADRLAKIVKEGLEGMDEYDHPFVTEVRNTLAAWKEARND